MDFQPSYGQGQLRLLWAGLRAVSGNIKISGVRNRQNYSEIVMVYTQFTNVAAGGIMQPGGPRAVGWRPMTYVVQNYLSTSEALCSIS
jgi:hypothetical protein